MNLFFKSYKFYIFFFLICVLKAPLLLGQNGSGTFNLIPEILEFDIPTPFLNSLNTSFVRNNKGIIFIGKENGILVLDDEETSFLSLKDPVLLGLNAQDRVVYCTTSDFGYLDYRMNQGLNTRSLTDQIRPNYRVFDPINIESFDDKLFIATNAGVIFIQDSLIKHFSFEGNSGKLFNSGEHLFLEIKEKGLYEWSDDEFIASIPNSAIQGNKIISVLDWKNNVLLCFENGTNSVFDPASKKSVIEDALQKINESYFFLKELKNNDYLCKNSANDLCIYSGTNSNSTPLCMTEYLSATGLNSIFLDSFDDIWLLYDFKLLKMEYPSRSYLVDLGSLIDGNILASAVSEKSLFLATSNGFFRISPENSEILDPARLNANPGDYFQYVSERNGIVVTSGRDGLYEVLGNSIQQIDAGEFSFIYLLDDKSLLALNKTGLTLYEIQKETWKKQLLDVSIEHIYSWVEVENTLWLHCGKDLYSYSTKSGISKILLKNTILSEELELLVFDSVPALADANGIYRWDQGMKQFQAVNMQENSSMSFSSGTIFTHAGHSWNIQKDFSGNTTLWKISESKMSAPFYEISAGKNFGQVVDIDENNAHIWITGNSKLIRLDKEKEPSEPENLLRLKEVRLKYLGKKGYEIRINPSQKIKYRRNQIVFELADRRFQKDPSPTYRYRLSHYQEDWSDWSRSKKFVASNLKERDYDFEAQSVSSFGTISEVLSFHFSIKPPLYRKWYAYLFYLLILLSAAFLLYKWRLLTLKRVEYKIEERIKERMASVLSEKEKSDKLVDSLFPKGTADEIKSKGRAASKKFEMATVLFSDIQGFTKIAEEMNPEELIDELDKFFFHFDSVVEKYNIEKIKTIGDAYMAAGGIPVKNSSNPVEVVLAGIEMQNYMNELKLKKADIWDLRIGIHTGPVISGVVGHKKLSYDIWGDTVNTASRMESSGEGGKVNISGTTYSHVKDFFICEYRGKLPVKYKGNIDMYFVTGLRPELSVDLQGMPNRRFYIKLQMLRLPDIEERIFSEIFENHDLALHFHKNDYLHKIQSQTQLLGRSENLSDDELLLTQTAAILLYSGLSESYENVELKSAEIARRILPEFAYNVRQIDRIVNLILATREPFNPQDSLEAILIDAKMEYLGRSDYLIQVKLLFLEEKNLIKDMSKDLFIKKQIERLESFNYFTLAARRLREVPAAVQVNNLKSWK